MKIYNKSTSFYTQAKEQIKAFFGVKSNYFYIIIFLWEKITNTFQMWHMLWHGDYPLSKFQEN